jgi:uncharacterized Zn finger protein
VRPTATSAWAGSAELARLTHGCSRLAGPPAGAEAFSIAAFSQPSSSRDAGQDRSEVAARQQAPWTLGRDQSRRAASLHPSPQALIVRRDGRAGPTRRPAYGGPDCRVSGALGRMLDRSFLRARAGARSYERGLGYFEAGCVEKVVLEGELLLASVQGTQRYRVELRPGEGSLEHSCSCPYGRDGAFCKHCVAAGLAFLEASADPPEPWPEPLSLDAIRERLEDLDREALQSLLLEQARADERVLERLRLWFAADSERVELESFRRAIELAVDPGDFVSYHEAYDWSRGIDEVIDAVESLLDDGHAGAVIELSEHVLAALAGPGGRIDDSSGHVALLCERLERLHLTACERARPDPEELAERLLRWQLDCEL